MSEPTQSFSVKQLGWMRRWQSQAHLRAADGSRPTKPVEWDAFLKDVASTVANDAFRFQGLKWHRSGSKQVLSTGLLEDAIVIRKINDNIRRAYGIRQPNRSVLIRTAKQALTENTPKSVLRIDLRSCFESINRNILLRTLRADAKLSTQTMALIDLLFSRAAELVPGNMPEGIPRGLTISTSLAELKLRQLDARLRAVAGTYLVLRYVDDILLFSTEEPAAAMDAARAAITSEGFRVNPRKTSSPMRIGCKCDPVCAHGNQCPCSKSCGCLDLDPALVQAEYLGYKLLFAKHNEKKSSNAVYLTLSDRKVSRVKSRIVRAIEAGFKSRDWQLLADRIEYLAGNQRVATSPNKRGLFNGLAYTHSEYWAPPNSKGTGTLEDLDSFYRALLRKAVKAHGLLPLTYRLLRQISFFSGFHKKRRTKFSPLRVIEIQSCWEA